jgi:predicted phage tail protein
MTNIYLMGILREKFGSIFKGYVKNALSALKLIDCNKRGFLDEIFNLNKLGFNYSIICDGEIIKNKNELIENKCIKSIYIIPNLEGSGDFIAISLGLAAQGSLTFMGHVVSFLVNTAISLAISFLTSSLNNQGSMPQRSSAIAIGGATATIEAQGKSYVFSNKENIASQGSAIPVGYGKMKINSQVIHANIKTYSTNYSFTNESEYVSNDSYFIDYITN